MKAPLQLYPRQLTNRRDAGTNCPAGLEWLLPLDRLYVNRQYVGQTGETRTRSTTRRYSILNATSEEVASGHEESNVTKTCCFGCQRSWEFRIDDTNSRDVLRISQQSRYGLKEITVRSKGQLLGSIKQNVNIWRPSYSIREDEGYDVLWLKGPMCWGCDCLEIDFQVTPVGKKHPVGMITKEWSGLVSENSQDGNSFSVSFPTNLDVRIKAVLIGATILVDSRSWTPRKD